MEKELPLGHHEQNFEVAMNCESCVFYSRFQQNPGTTPCINCASDYSDKGYCVAVSSEFGLVPVITKIADEDHARDIIARGMRNGGYFELLQWSTEINAYLIV